MNHFSEGYYDSDDSSDRIFDMESLTDSEDEEIIEQELVPLIISEEDAEEICSHPFRLKDQVINELKERIRYAPDFKYQCAWIDVCKEVREFDNTKLRWVERTHWIKYFKSFF